METPQQAAALNPNRVSDAAGADCASGHNLSRTLSVNLYLMRYVADPAALVQLERGLFCHPTAAELATVLSEVCRALDATVLHLTSHDYEPHGASAAALVADGVSPPPLVAHLAQSHVTVHTYPQLRPDGRVASVRIELEIASCGPRSPWLALPYLLARFDADAAIIDYRVRGFWWSAGGQRHVGEVADEAIAGLPLPPALAARYERVDAHQPAQRTWHSRLRRRALGRDHVVRSGALSSQQREAGLRILAAELAAVTRQNEPTSGDSCAPGRRRGSG